MVETATAPAPLDKGKGVVVVPSEDDEDTEDGQVFKRRRTTKVVTSHSSSNNDVESLREHPPSTTSPPPPSTGFGGWGWVWAHTYTHVGPRASSTNPRITEGLLAPGDAEGAHLKRPGRRSWPIILGRSLLAPTLGVIRLEPRPISSQPFRLLKKSWLP